QNDLESVASLFGHIVTLRRNGQIPERDEAWDEGVALDAHVRVVMRTMNKRLAVLEEGPSQASKLDAEVIMAKHSLYSICFQELIKITNGINSDLSRALEQLRDAHDSLLQDVPGVVQRTLDGFKEEVSSLRESKQRDAREATELVEAAQALERETIAHHQELRHLHGRLRELQEENASLKNDQAAGRRPSAPRPRTPLWQSDTCGFADATASVRKTPPVDQASATPYSCQSWAEERMTPKPQKKYGSSCFSRRHMPSAAQELEGNSRRPFLPASLHMQDLIASVYASKEKYDDRCASQRLPSQTLTRHLDDFLIHRYGLTLMAKDQAAALRRGMDKFRDNDNAVKVFELTLRNEVDEGFQLEQRKLERAVVDCVRVRIRDRMMRRDKAAKYEDRYSYRRSAGISKVAVMNTDGGTGKQGQQRASGGGTGRVGGDARAYSGVLAAAASTANVESLLRSQTRPGARFAAEDWMAVVRHVYKGSTTADARTAGFLVKEAVSTWREEQPRRDHDQRGSGKGAAGVGLGQGKWSVPFGLFLQVLLEYQLHGYLRRLKRFREDFREVDVDADGVLNPVQFLTLAKQILRRAQRATPPSCRSPSRKHDAAFGASMAIEAHGGHHPVMSGVKERPNVVEQQAVARLRAADPHGFGSITYSQCVLHLDAS
ncbi:unnamed protein product, partial [Scytosiphon promiscuus]